MTEVRSLTSLLSGNPYPGRGLALGLTKDGRYAVSVYFIMGRSRNSRNRIFVGTEDGIRTEAYDPVLVEDPSLIIYRAVRALPAAQSNEAGNDSAGEKTAYTIVTNGDQTDTIYEGLLSGLTFEEALKERTFEPDAPNYTPRISGLHKRGDGCLSYEISLLKSLGGDPQYECRGSFSYSPARPGVGHFISTYVTDGEPLPSFEGEPVAVTIPENIEEWADEIWQALDPDNKISLYVRVEELKEGGSVWETIMNRNEG